MKTFQLPATALIAFAFATLCTAPANARCVYKKSQFRTPRAAIVPAPEKLVPRLTTVDPEATPADPSIVGLWYARFVTGGQLVDDGFDVWLSDGLEILNDSTIPSQGNVCLGVWVKIGPRSYSLKHPTWLYDESGVNLIGVGMLREKITLDSKGATYTGELTIDIYDLAGNPLDHETTAITGTRIAATDDQSPVTGAGIPGLPASILDR